LDEKQIIESKIDLDPKDNVLEYSNLFNETRELLENPYGVWKDCDIEHKRLLVRVLFYDKMSY